MEGHVSDCDNNIQIYKSKLTCNMDRVTVNIRVSIPWAGCPTSSYPDG